MIEHDFSSEIPPEANAIEILVTTTPTSGEIEVRRSLEDDEPLTMGYGSRTTLGVPENCRLYVVKLPPTEDYTIEIMRWME